jgi:predicted nucleic-acid-binding protein
MLAVDTNIVVRYLTADDPPQFAQAVAVMEEAETYVCLTVLLETEWVLRSAYRYQPAQTVRALRSLAGLPNVTVEEPPLVNLALQWVEQGLDFADALHLAKAQSCDAFVSFDRDLAQRAIGLGTVPVRGP